MAKFPFYQQMDNMDCGPTCVRMIAKYYGKHYSLQYLREKSYISREGISFQGMSSAAESIGLRTLAVKLDFDTLQQQAPLPCIVHWQQMHFIVVYKITKRKVYVADPAFGLLKYSKKEFLKSWVSTKNQGTEEGLLMILQPTPEFYQAEDEPINRKSFGFLFSYLKGYKKYIVQLVLGLATGSLLQLIFPFLTQSVVDIGINTQNINFVNTILLAQLMLFGGRTAVEFIRSWILLHISTRVNISLISDFLVKLMKLPISFFDAKITGDILQRINDHKRIETFLTNSSLSTLFSLFNLVIFSVVLWLYSGIIVGTFIGFTIAHVIYVTFFLKKRRELDFKRFYQLADNQNTLVQLITGMQEIKLNNYEKQKRWQWERIQAALFKVNIKSLALEQWQQLGALIFNESKNILITFIAAREVINGNMTLGAMMAVSYILGQLNTPITELIHFLQAAQDAQISLERLGEIHEKDAEEDAETAITMLPDNRDLILENMSFQYGGPESEMVLKDINLTIPAGKVTAIVGTSGSGKSTLIKLLLKFYSPTKGKIKLGSLNLKNLENRLWRDKCGVVMQNGFIFSDSIARNIAVADEIIDKVRLIRAVQMANIQHFVETLPLNYNTKIGHDGLGMSGGQKQRMLIARAIYKNPEYLFFDEATNALDAENERIIVENLNSFYKGRTVVVVAHRLSTVKNADQIIVLERGELVEKGTHEELVKLKGRYFNLVKNQLELGN